MSVLVVDVSVDLLVVVVLVDLLVAFVGHGRLGPGLPVMPVVKRSGWAGRRLQRVHPAVLAPAGAPGAGGGVNVERPQAKPEDVRPFEAAMKRPEAP